MTQTNEQLLQVVRDLVDQYKRLAGLRFGGCDDGDYARCTLMADRASSALAELEARLEELEAECKQANKAIIEYTMTDSFLLPLGSAYRPELRKYVIDHGYCARRSKNHLHVDLSAKNKQPPAGEQE